MRGADALDLARSITRPRVARRVPARHARLDRELSQLSRTPNAPHSCGRWSTLDEDRQHGLARARSLVTKPTTREGLQAALARIKDYSAPRRRGLAGG